MFDPSAPHNGLPPLTKMALPRRDQLLATNMAAYVALARLDEAIKHIPHPEILLSSVCTIEAVDSSKIENIITTGDALFRHRILPLKETDDATRQASRYPLAIAEAEQSLRRLPLSFRSAADICSTLLATNMWLRPGPVALRNEVTRAVVYTPPDQQYILLNLIGDWENFIHAIDDLDPLTRIAVAHSQFVAIHPFTDGNGRTARILHSMMLLDQKLLSHPVLYLSRFLLAQRPQYYASLKAVNASGQWLNWIAFVATVTTEAATYSYGVVSAIRTLYAQTRQILQRSAPHLCHDDMLSLLFRQPYCRIEDMQAAQRVQRAAASRHLRQLESLGILRGEQVGRDKIWRHNALLSALRDDGR